MADKVVDVIKYTTYKDKYYVPRFALPEFIQEVEDMEVREDDIFVVTYPKSGSVLSSSAEENDARAIPSTLRNGWRGRHPENVLQTGNCPTVQDCLNREVLLDGDTTETLIYGTHWMQEVVHLILVGGHVSKLSASERRLIIEIADIATPTPELLAATGPTLRKMVNAPSPRVLTTHIQHPLLPKQVREKGCKVVYVYRHPKDVITSDYNFCRKLLKQECGKEAPDTPENFAYFFNKAMDGKISYGSWMDHVIQYSKETDNENFLFVSFEAMKANLGSVVTEVASFIGHPLDEEAVQRVVQGASVESMRTTFTKDKQKAQQEEKNQKFDPTIFINKGKVSQWKHRFTPDQNEYFDRLFQEKMKNCHLVKHYIPTEGATV